MSAARPTAAMDADFEEVADQRRTDRRAQERRSRPHRFDPLFAATLLSHVLDTAEGMASTRYASAKRAAGAKLNIRA